MPATPNNHIPCNPTTAHTQINPAAHTQSPPLRLSYARAELLAGLEKIQERFAGTVDNARGRGLM